MIKGATDLDLDEIVKNNPNVNLEQLRNMISKFPRYTPDITNQVLNLASKVLNQDKKYCHLADKGIIVNYRQKYKLNPDILIDLNKETGSHLIPPFLTDKYDIRTDYTPIFVLNQIKSTLPYGPN